MRKLKLVFCILFQVITVYFFSTEVSAVCPPPFAKIDSISAHDECLDINDKTKFCGGSIEIKNNCKGIYYIEGEPVKPGSAVYPSLPNPTWSIVITNSNRTENIIVKGTSNEENLTSGENKETDRILLFFRVIIILVGFICAFIILKKLTPKRRVKR